MATDEPRPYDLAALVAAAGARVEARRLHVSGSAFARMRLVGLTERQADEAAVRLGLHPGLVWERWWQRDDADDDVVDGAMAEAS